MTLDSLAKGRMFGMIQPDPAAPRGETGPGLYRIGCLGRVSSFAETEDGRLLITLTGVTRFRVAAELEMRHGYRRIRADYAGFAADLDLDERPAAVERSALLGALRPFFKARGIEAELGSDRADLGSPAGADVGHGLPLRGAGEAGAAGGGDARGARGDAGGAAADGGASEPGAGDMSSDRRPS